VYENKERRNYCCRQGRERTIPLPKDVKQAIDHYLKLDAGRRRHLHSDGDDAFIFQPIVIYRTLEFDKALSARHICQIVNRWADFAGLNQNPDKGDPDRLGLRNKPKPRLKLSPWSEAHGRHPRVKLGLHPPPGAEHDRAQRYPHGCQIRS